MGERIAALAALSRIRALVEQIPTQAASPAQAPIEVQEAAVPQSAQAITASRPLQELAGLRQMAETTSQSTSPNINAQRVDRLGAALSRLAESTVDPPNAIEPRQSVADVLDAGAGNRLSYNRAILEMLRGGFETARRAVPAVEAPVASAAYCGASTSGCPQKLQVRVMPTITSLLPPQPEHVTTVL